MVIDRAAEQPAYVAQAIRLGFLSESGEPDMLLHQEFLVEGPLDVDRLSASVRRLVTRRDSLRSYFELRGDRGWQVFLPPGEGPTLRVRDFEGEEDALAWLRHENWAPFPLFGGPTARFVLARLDPSRHLFGFACTHNISDGSSMELIASDLEALYEGSAPGEAPSFAAWARRRSRHLAEIEAREREFWRRQFPDPPPGAKLPPLLDESPTSSIIAPSMTLDGERLRALRRLAGENRTSLYTVLLAAVHVARAREQGTAELTYAVNVANRDDATAEATVGCLTHRVLIRVGGDIRDFTGLLRGVRDRLLAVLSHSAVPFRVVRSWLADWHGTQTPGSELTYVVLGPEWGGNLRLPGTRVSRLRPDLPDPGSEGLEFWFTEEGGGVTLELRYPPAHYTHTAAANLCRVVGQVLDATVGGPTAVPAEPGRP